MGIFDFARNSNTEKRKAEDINPDVFTQRANDLERKYVNESMSKGMNMEDKTVDYPLMGSMDVSPDFKSPVDLEGKTNADLLRLLKRVSTSNGIVNSIIGTRMNQVSNYCRPARYSERGIGYEIRLKDPKTKPSTHDYKNFKRIEAFLEHTSKDDMDLHRDNFSTFVKKMVMDTLRYDKVNFELTYDENEVLHHFQAVDASTIFQAAIGNERRPANSKDDVQFVQMLEQRKEAEYRSKEMAWEVRRPRTDIEVGKYGLSELEQAMRYMVFHDSVEEFNYRYFLQGGTVRGLIHMKAGEQQSQHALDAFRREWSTMFTGTSGAWRIPIVNAEDINFVNMTQSMKDMEFEKWLNYNINIMCAIFTIDPSEIGFPNKGGATGSGGSSLQESSQKDKTQASQSKGLQPLLRFIEDAINKYIINQIDKKYTFQFVGGDSETEREILETLTMKVKNGMSFNEAREELGLSGTVPGGEATNAGVTIQYMGQQLQEKMMERQHQQKQQEMMMQQTGTGMDGSSSDVNGKDAVSGAKKDGQAEGAPQTNKNPQGGKESNGDPDEWAID